MRGIKVAGFLLILGAGTAAQAQVQQGSTPQDPPPAQTDGQKKPVKSNRLDPNGKVTDLPDPTKDPTKDPPLDPTKDPSKEPAEQSDSQDAKGAAGADAVDAPDYTGPAILSRGYALSRPTLPTNEPFRVYAGVNAVYDSGLAGAYVVNGGVLQTTSTAGADFNWGASMRKYHRRSILDFNYNGHYYNYSTNTQYGGQDHSLSAWLHGTDCSSPHCGSP